ncbi:Uncharacterised protein [Klebsiella pneumoniae]|uniref:hypothetical protein n=1 Tax=Klebsiella pneumoniae TaxID=573 RepID=UPI0007CCB716|nr:hypothetical protein [Klebsiella pneumoniae]SAU94981.1 Uncharacterised protein [Klebsiella pneumoniae]
MHAFIFLVLMTPSSGGGIWDITPMPNTGECIEIKTREPLSSVIETLNEGG